MCSRAGFCPICMGQLLDGAFPNQPQHQCRGSRLSSSKRSWGKVQHPSSIPPASIQHPPSNAGSARLPISSSTWQRQNQLLSHSHLQSSPGTADALSLPCPRSRPGTQHLAPEPSGQAPPSSPSNGEMFQRTGLTMFLLSRCTQRQRGTSGCSSRSQSWPKPCRAHASGRLPPLLHPFSAPPQTATAPARTVSLCPHHRGEAVSPHFWPSGISFCLPKQPPCSCPGHRKGSLLVITKWCPLPPTHRCFG